MRWVVPVLCVLVAGAAETDGLTARAEGGDPAAQFELATMYDLGNGRPQNARTAFKLFQQAAEAGLPDAEFNVAVMLDSGRGTTQNLNAAAAWYARSAAQGNHRAQYNLGLLYAAGDGVPRNADLAAFWFRQAAVAVPAAGRRLATLRAGNRTSALSAATPVVPRDRIATGQAPIEFVWTASAQPELVHFLVEIRALDEAGSREVYSDFTDGSAMLAPLREIPGNYAWRVFTLAHVAARYTSSDWTLFTVTPQSIAQ